MALYKPIYLLTYLSEKFCTVTDILNISSDIRNSFMDI